MKERDTISESLNTDFKLPTKNSYSHLFRRFTLLTVLCSVIPLLLVGWGINIHYTYFAKSRTLNTFRDRVANHRRFIEKFLNDQSSKLRLIAYTHSKISLLKDNDLAYVFENINKDYPSITDLGIIDQDGNHLAYIGPYDLLDKNYKNEPWFQEVMKKGLYISDIFLGFRRRPHFIVAVLRTEKDSKWILRATINSHAFRSLVENIRIGESGEVFLLDRQGRYQTEPRYSGSIMEKANVEVESFDEPVRVIICENDAEIKVEKQIIGMSWLSQPRWLLVVKQSCSEAFSEMKHAQFSNLFFLHLSALSILVAIFFIARHMISIIKRRDQHVANLNMQLMQTGKLASIGELSAGVAHEINNPIAIIMTERQLLLDAFNNSSVSNCDFTNQFLASMEQIAVQCQRCKHITQNLLRFSRRTHSMIEPIDLNQFIQEVVDLMEREAKTSGIKFITNLDQNLVPIESDPSQLQQVFLNMITNAIDAHEGKPYGSIQISTKYDDNSKGVFITISDTGSGIPKEHLDRIFDPFFTTKPVGKGTGLGLSICYSIIKQLGGDITVRSVPMEGTEFIIFLPSKITNKSVNHNYESNNI